MNHVKTVGEITCKLKVLTNNHELQANLQYKTIQFIS